MEAASGVLKDGELGIGAGDGGRFVNIDDDDGDGLGYSIGGAVADGDGEFVGVVGVGVGGGFKVRDSGKSDCALIASRGDLLEGANVVAGDNLVG